MFDIHTFAGVSHVTVTIHFENTVGAILDLLISYSYQKSKICILSVRYMQYVLTEFYTSKLYLLTPLPNYRYLIECFYNNQNENYFMAMLKRIEVEGQ